MPLNLGLLLISISAAILIYHKVFHYKTRARPGRSGDKASLVVLIIYIPFTLFSMRLLAGFTPAYAAFFIIHTSMHSFGSAYLLLRKARLTSINRQLLFWIGLSSSIALPIAIVLTN